MFTVCPKCALTLVVTAADLRVAQGYVRCGRCLHVFNALARLSEERPAGTPAPLPDAVPAEGPHRAPLEPAASPAAEETGEIAGEIEVELDSSILVTAARPPAAPQETAEPEAQAHDPLPAEPSSAQAAAAAATLAEATDMHLPPIEPPTEPLMQPPPGATADVSPDTGVRPERAEPSPSPGIPGGAPQTNTTQPPDDTFGLITQRLRPRLAWTLGAGALAIVLALQIVNHYRDALAASPALEGALSAVYSAVGVKLAPRWNVKAYDVRQLGASVDGVTAGEIVVRASVKNAASRAQPLPLLRVTLQDRFGNRIAARDVPPRDYLPTSVAPSSLLAAGRRVDATMVFADPGPQAVGFEIDACLPLQSGAVACAHGP